MIPVTPITTPDAWVGEMLQSDVSWIERLTSSDIAELRAAVVHARATGKDMKDWTRDDFPLPALSARIARWSRELDRGRGFVLVRGLPVMELGKEASAFVYWGMGLYMGRAISQNTDGDLLGHVRDTGADPKKYGVRLYKTRAEQDFHTDGADIIGLLCLRQAKSGGVSRIVSSVSLFNEMARARPDLLSTMFEAFPFDTQGQQRPGERGWFPLNICQFTDDRLRTFYIPWYIRESQQHADAPRLTAAQQDVLSFLEATANDPRFYLDMHFEPGDIQFLKNASVFHKRSEYEDFDEPDMKRHLLRLWLVDPAFSAGDEKLRKGIERVENPVAATLRMEKLT